jgi:hypothetical protein
MDTRSFGQVVGRVVMAAGFAFALSACSMRVEDPPRAMYGTTAWSDSWKMTCNDVDPTDVQLKAVDHRHLGNDCQQYQVAQQMGSRLPILAASK